MPAAAVSGSLSPEYPRISPIQVKGTDRAHPWASYVAMTDVEHVHARPDPFYSRMFIEVEEVGNNLYRLQIMVSI